MFINDLLGIEPKSTLHRMLTTPKKVAIFQDKTGNAYQQTVESDPRNTKVLPTVMPDNNLSFDDWYRGKWSQFLHL